MGAISGYTFILSDPPILQDPAYTATASDVSDTGVVVGGTHTVDTGVITPLAFKYDLFSDSITMLPTLTLSWPSIAYAVTSVNDPSDNSNMDIVVGTSGGQAVKWPDSSAITPLGALTPGGISYALDISADAEVIVGQAEDANGMMRAFRWTALTGMASIGVLTGFDHSTVTAVSGDGSVIVGYCYDLDINNNQVTATDAFIWDIVNGMRTLKSELIALGVTNVNDWTLARATGVNNDGRVVVGFGWNSNTPSNETDGWVVDFGVPTSTTLVGDYDNSGQVGQSDLDLVLLNWGQSTPPIPATWVNDLPDSVISQNELDKVVLNWGDRNP